MRGKIFILTVAMVLIASAFCGCPQKETAAQKAADQVQAATTAFETTARVQYKGLEAIMTMNKGGADKHATVTFESPESLRDLKMIVYSDKTTMEYKGLSVDVDSGSMPAKAVSSIVLEAFNAAMNPQGIYARQDGEKLIVQGAIDEGDFELVLDSANGNVLKMTMPQNDLEIEIINFKILE